jgi:hypothetical protein
MEWIQLAQDRVQWQALANMATKLQIPLKPKKFLDQLNNYLLQRKVPVPRRYFII